MLDKQSPSKIAFDRREGFSLVTRLRRAVGGRLLGPNLERSETLVKRETWGRSCHSVETNKSPESKSLRSIERVLKPLRLIYRPWGCSFKGISVAPESTLALLFLFFTACNVADIVSLTDSLMFLKRLSLAWHSFRTEHYSLTPSPNLWDFYPTFEKINSEVFLAVTQTWAEIQSVQTFLFFFSWSKFQCFAEWCQVVKNSEITKMIQLIDLQSKD